MAKKASPVYQEQHGAIKFGDTAKNCSLHTAGIVRYITSQNALQLCDGRTWLPLVTAGKGHVSYNPGRHCLDIVNSGEYKKEQQCNQESVSRALKSRTNTHQITLLTRSFIHFKCKYKCVHKPTK